MSKEKVISREYKIMLRANLFGGGERQLLKAASEFWQDFKGNIYDSVIKIDGTLEKAANRRIIEFYDTDNHLLYKNYYIFRERCNIDTDEREVTLKFRHPDRYISQDRNMEAGNATRNKRKDNANKVKTKFEEDIKPPFLKLYSFSTTQKISDTKNLSQLKDVTRLYPHLYERIDHYTEDEKIKIVGSTIRELVITGARFQISKKPTLNSECALIVWYNNDTDEEKPAAVEFSFRYGDKNENYTRNMAQRAYTVFQILQKKLTRWIDPKSETKTAYIYS